MYIATSITFHQSVFTIHVQIVRLKYLGFHSLFIYLSLGSSYFILFIIILFLACDVLAMDKLNEKQVSSLYFFQKTLIPI